MANVLHAEFLAKRVVAFGIWYSNDCLHHKETNWRNFRSGTYRPSWIRYANRCLFWRENVKNALKRETITSPKIPIKPILFLLIVWLNVLRAPRGDQTNGWNSIRLKEKARNGLSLLKKHYEGRGNEKKNWKLVTLKNAISLKVFTEIVVSSELRSKTETANMTQTWRVREIECRLAFDTLMKSVYD